MEFVAIPIGHAGIALNITIDHLTSVFAAVRPHAEQARASDGISQPDTDSNAKSHEYRLFKSPIGSLTNLAQSNLLGIIKNKKRLVEALPGAIGHHRAHHSAATPTHSRAAEQKKAATHTYRTHITRVPESTPIM